MSDSTAVSISEARTAVCSDRRASSQWPPAVYLACRGRRVAADIDADELDRILQLAEDMTDILAAEQAREEVKSTAAMPITWDEVKAYPGLT